MSDAGVDRQRTYEDDFEGAGLERWKDATTFVAVTQPVVAAFTEVGNERSSSIPEVLLSEIAGELAAPQLDTQPSIEPVPLNAAECH